MCGVRTLLFVALALLAGCGSNRDDVIERAPSHITAVVFTPAHDEEHCSKGCHTDHYPDKWTLTICHDVRARVCGGYDSRYAPLTWQAVGTLVVAEWGHAERGWHIHEVWPP